MDARLKAHFLSLYCMIVADQEVSFEELEELYRIGTEYYNLTDSEINHVIMHEGTAFYNPQSYEDKISYLYELALIAYADGKIVPEEQTLLEKYAIRFGIAPEKVHDLIKILLSQACKKETKENVIRLVMK